MTQTRRAELIRAEVDRRVEMLQRDYLDANSSRNSWATATLARLRRCPVDLPGSDPTVWDITVGDLPVELLGTNESSPAERAVHASLVLFATHQQSQNIAVHVRGQSLGDAVRRLADVRGAEGAPDEPSMRRLHQVVLTDDSSGRLYHLRALVTLFRAETPPVPLDYGRLAVDLWRLFEPHQDSSIVVSQWGRDLHNRPRSTTTGESE